MCHQLLSTKRALSGGGMTGICEISFQHTPNARTLLCAIIVHARNRTHCAVASSQQCCLIMLSFSVVDPCVMQVNAYFMHAFADV